MQSEYPQRRHPRLREYDYSTGGAYFVTVCVKDRGCILSTITVGRGLAPAEVRLLPAGHIVEEELRALPERFPMLTVEKYVIMPNHIHLLMCISAAGASPRPTDGGKIDIPRMIGALKSLSTRRWNADRGVSGERLWQTSFHDHVIRDENDFLNHWEYIEGNPFRWTEDEYYT